MHNRRHFLSFTCLASLSAVAAIALAPAACSDSSSSTTGDAAVDVAPADALPGADATGDANDAASCTAGAFQWATSGGGPGQYDQVLGVARDKDGNTWVSGTFIGSATWGTTQLTGFDQTHTTGFFAKLDPSGKVIFARSLGAESWAYRVRVDAQGNAYIGGTFDTSLTFDGIQLQHNNSGALAGFVLAVDTTGHGQWGVATAGSGSREHIYDLALDPATGDVFVSGSYNGHVTLAATPTGGTSDEAPFVARYSHAQGKWLWAQGWSGPTSNSGGQGVGVTRTNDGVVIASTLQYDVDLGDGQILGGGSDTGSFLVKLDAGDGHKLWATHLTSDSDQHETHVAAITSDASNNLYVTGLFEGTAGFQPPAATGDAGTADASVGPTLSSHGHNDLLVVKYDASGNVQWAKQAYTDTTTTRGDDIVWDGANAIYVGGFHQGATTFAGSSVTLPDAGGGSAFVARYDLSGNATWASTNVNDNVGGGEASAVAFAGGVLVAGGSYVDKTTFGTVQLTTAGQDDAFVTQLCP